MRALRTDQRRDRHASSLVGSRERPGSTYRYSLYHRTRYANSKAESWSDASKAGALERPVRSRAEESCQVSTAEAAAFTSEPGRRGCPLAALQAAQEPRAALPGAAGLMDPGWEGVRGAGLRCRRGFTVTRLPLAVPRGGPKAAHPRGHATPRQLVRHCCPESAEPERPFPDSSPRILE